MLGVKVKKARNPGGDRKGAAGSAQQAASLRFLLSAICVAVAGSRLLALLLCCPSGLSVLQERRRETEDRLYVCCIPGNVEGAQEMCYGCFFCVLGSSGSDL